MNSKDFMMIALSLSKLIKGTEFENKVYAVGGCCRDMVMDNDIKDIDLCVELPNGGIMLSEYLKSIDALKGNVVTYPTYGTAMFHLKEFPDVELECVMTRGEQYHDKDSRNPQTTFAPLYEDCVRRDLTINALYYNISKFEFLDPTGLGRSDINFNIIRVTNDNPDVVFSDDPLRILRCIRFASRYNWKIEENTYNSMLKNMDRLSIITQERITNEFCKMITSDYPLYAMSLLKETGAMKYVLPELIDTYDMAQNDFHFGTVYEHTIKTLYESINFKKRWHVDYDTLLIRISCILHDIGKVKTRTIDENGRIHFYEHERVGAEYAREILVRMKFPNKFINEVCFLVKNHMLTKNWGDNCKHMKDNKLRKLQLLCGTEERFNNLMCIIHSDNMSHKNEHCMPNQVNNIYRRCYDFESNGTSMFGYKLPINGYDVIVTQNVKPSKIVKKYLNIVMNNALSNPKITRDECLKIIKNTKIK